MLLSIEIAQDQIIKIQGSIPCNARQMIAKYSQISMSKKIYRSYTVCIMTSEYKFTCALNTTNFLEGRACWVTIAGGSGHLAGTGEGNSGYVDSGTSCSAHARPSSGMLTDDSCKVF